jgi:hypothetical protein
VGKTLDESLSNLKDFTLERIVEIQKLTLKEIDVIEREYPEKWNKLEKLDFLEPLSSHLSDIKLSNASQIGSMALEVKAFNQNLEKVVDELHSMRDIYQKRDDGHSLSGSVRRFLGIFSKNERK